MNKGLATCIKRAQEIAFPEEMRLLRKKTVVSASSKLKQFTPYVDVESGGLLRVGGRLKSAPIDYDSQHPIILPADQRINDIII